MNQIDTSTSPGSTWLLFSLFTVGCWGLYGAFLHSGQVGMNDPINGRYKAFLWVGLAYFLTAVLAPLAVLLVKGASWSFTTRGIGWSLSAGIVGALGAFGVLLAFGAKGTPAVVMSIVFAGAPVLNALYSMATHPPAGGWSKLPWPFVLGIVLAAVGGCLVSLYKPAQGAAPGKAAITHAAAPSAPGVANTASYPASKPQSA
jgi:drug/metabolite transporter (DMT)-like permease